MRKDVTANSLRRKWKYSFFITQSENESSIFLPPKHYLLYKIDKRVLAVHSIEFLCPAESCVACRYVFRYFPTTSVISSKAEASGGEWMI